MIGTGRNSVGGTAIRSAGRGRGRGREGRGRGRGRGGKGGKGKGGKKPPVADANNAKPKKVLKKK